MKKYIILALFALFISAALVSVPVSADENGFVIKTDADGDKYVAGYNGSGGDIVIPDGVVWIGKKAFSENDTITSVTIPASCWYWIDNNAFALCRGLKTVTFKGSIDGLGKYAFYGCTALEKVTFGGSVGREEGDGGIGYYAFGGCSSLKTVSFSDSNAALDLIGENAFISCVRLTSIDLPSGTGTVYSGAFLNCASLKEITLPESATLDGKYILGYMYGRKTKDGDLEYVKADGSASVYPVNLQYLEKAEKKIAQKTLTVSAVKGSDGAKYAAGNGIACNYVSGRSRLSAPKNIEHTESGGKLVLTWDKVEGAAGYRVYILNAETGKYETYKSVKKTKCTISDAEAGKEYSVRIAALSSSGDSYTPGKRSKTVTVSTVDS